MHFRRYYQKQWIIQQVYNEMHYVPDIIWDKGEPEKEPMIRLFCKDAQKAIQKLKTIINLTETES